MRTSVLPRPFEAELGQCRRLLILVQNEITAPCDETTPGNAFVEVVTWLGNGMAMD